MQTKKHPFGDWVSDKLGEFYYFAGRKYDYLKIVVI